MYNLAQSNIPPLPTPRAKLWKAYEASCMRQIIANSEYRALRAFIPSQQ